MKKKTFYHIILDRSGSMSSCWDTTITALNEELLRVTTLRQKHEDQDIFLSVCVFNETVLIPVPASNEANPDMSWTILSQPAGLTALYDAIGDSINYLKSQQASKQNESENFVVIVISDGHENSSRRYHPIQLKREMDHLQNSGNWMFAFIGADFDITQTASTFGISQNNIYNSEKSKIGETFSLIGEMLDETIELKKQGKNKNGFFSSGDAK